MSQEASSGQGRLPAERSIYFGFGSNSIKQLQGRLNDQTLAGFPARIDGHVLAFGGPNHTWAVEGDEGVEKPGGTATLIPGEGEVALGTACYMTEEQLAMLDTFEGVPYVYQREELLAQVLEQGMWREAPVICYIRQRKEWFRPTEAYCCAVLRNLRGSFPSLHQLAIRDCEGQVQGTWEHPGFGRLGLGAFLFEVGIRRREPWQMPRHVKKVYEKIRRAGLVVSGSASDLKVAFDAGAAVPLDEEEAAIARSLLASPGSGKELRDGLGSVPAEEEEGAKVEVMKV